MEQKRFKTVFNRIKLSDRLVKAFESVYVKRIAASKADRKLKIELFSESFVNNADILRLENELHQSFKDASEIEINIHFNLICETGEFIRICKNDFCDRMSKRRPMMSEILKNSEWRMDKDRLIIALAADNAFLFTQSRIDKQISDYFTDTHGMKISLEFERTDAPVPELVSTAVPRPAPSVACKPKAPAAVPQAKPAQGGKAQKNKRANVLHGREIKGAAVPVSEAVTEGERVIIKGSVLSVDVREIKGERLLVKFDITDKTDSITAVAFIKKEKFAEISDSFKIGERLKLEGDLQYDKYSREVSLAVKSVEKLPPLPERTDDSPKKRVELHLHTQMSQMDAMASAKALIARAAKWGHTAIAITDHGVVQAFPEAMDAAKKHGVKVLYGMEGYLVGDIGSVVQMPKNQTIDDTFVVFDIETTGLKKDLDALTEIGAVRIENGEITGRFSTFVDPNRPIPHEITKLTGITQKMVKGAPSQSEAVRNFLDFAGDAVLVAHNASFDMGFISHAAAKEGITVENTVLDTLELSRTLFPELKKHKLESVAELLKINMGSAHRAADDANTTALLLLKAFEMLRGKGVSTLLDLNVYASENANYRKMRPHHVVIIAKNLVGLKNLYELVTLSSMRYFYKKPRILKSLLSRYREGLLIGSACGSGELFMAFAEGKPMEVIREIASFYDYFEVQPLGNNQFLLDNGTLPSVEALIEINKKIIALGEETGKPVVATGDVHFMEAEDEIYRCIIMKGDGYVDADRQPPLYFRTTEEMLAEFYYLEPDAARKVVIDNTNAVADMVERISPIPEGTFPPEIEGAEELLRQSVMEKAHSIYSENLPKTVSERLDKELDSIIRNGFSVMYIVAQKLVKNSEENGYLVGSRGSVGSSFAATMAGITEVNPLPPHYVCDNCKYSDFDSEVALAYAGGSGCDMPDMKCPVCGSSLRKDGHDIPFETFLGFNGEKEPDIDLNFSGDYQQRAHLYAEEIFGSKNVFKAGTINTLADKNAYGYVKKFFDEKGVVKRNAEINRLVAGLVGIKKTTGQHPGGLMVVPRSMDIHSFTPVQRPANDVKSTITTTHFDYHSISGRLLKLDLLGHDDPTVLKMLQDLTGIDPKSVPLDDRDTMSLFTSPKKLGVTKEQIGSETGTLGLPEFGTKFVRQMLMDTMPNSFAELIRISGLSHGTDVWLNNAQDYVRSGVAKLKDIISTRDDIMVYLIIKELDKTDAFKIMEDVRKGKGVKEEYSGIMRSHGVPEWYIESCNKIKYMFPKAHAAAYVMMAFRIAYYKLYYPIAFYASYFTVRADDFDYTAMCRGEAALREAMKELEIDEKGNAATAKEKSKMTIMEVVLEMYMRGFSFLPLDLYESDATRFIVVENSILPPLNSLPGLGQAAAESVAEARHEGEFYSIEDLRGRTSLSKTVIELLKQNGVLDDMPETSQLTLL